MRFLEYALDATNAELRRGDQVLPLRPKTLAVLNHLVAHAGRLVTKADLLDAVWGDTAVGDWVLSGCVRELRRIFADDARKPRIIQTVHTHGYRFIAQVIEAAESPARAAPPSYRLEPASPGTPLVGRAAELDELDAWLQRALSGDRQIGFIVGEAGIGKTALVDEFLRRLTTGDEAADRGTPNRSTACLVARGQCVEQHGTGEPYLPVLEALRRLCVESDAGMLALLRRHAPAWLVQLPGLLDAAEVEALEHRLGATTRERMLREIASFVEALPAPLVLVLEDLHWSDSATLDLISMLAQSRAPARLLLLATYRPVDVVIREHRTRSMHQGLRARGRCRDLWLEPLDESAVAAYLQTLWPRLSQIARLARLVHEHTDGNPLFLINVADYLSANGAIAAVDGEWRLQTDANEIRVGVPHGLHQMIALQVERLADDERALLEAGSLAGRSFSAALVAAALDGDVIETEERLARLAENGLMVVADGESVWPDSTAAGAYRLTHFLYQSVLRDRVPAARRRRLHERIATRLERAYRGHTADVAAELAFHFEACGQAERAVPYNEEGAGRAVRRGAAREALVLIDHGLGILDGLPATPERNLMAIRLCLARGVALAPVRGLGDAEIERAFARSRALSEESNDPIQLIQALFALGSTYVAQARLDQASELAQQLLGLAERMPLPAFVFISNFLAGVVAYHGGALTTARRHLEEAVAVQNVTLPALSVDPPRFGVGYLGLTLLHQGYPDQALARIQQAIEVGDAVDRPFDLSSILQLACFFFMQTRDFARLATAADEAFALGSANGFASPTAIGNVGRGRVMTRNGDERGIALMRAGVDAYRASGQVVAAPSLLAALAEGFAELDNLSEALECVLEARAIAEATGELRYRAELHRLEGEIKLRTQDRRAAEACFQRALETAREQGTRWLELRATVSLCRMQTATAGRKKARGELATIAGLIREGHDTRDVQEAHALLAGPS